MKCGYHNGVHYESRGKESENPASIEYITVVKVLNILPILPILVLIIDSKTNILYTQYIHINRSWIVLLSPEI